MMSNTVNRHLEAILNHFSWTTMSQSPGRGCLKPHQQIQLIIIFVSLRYDIINSKWQRAVVMQQLPLECFYSDFSYICEKNDQFCLISNYLT